MYKYNFLTFNSGHAVDHVVVLLVQSMSRAKATNTRTRLCPATCMYLFYVPILYMYYV